ncbi:MAG: protein involved in polysaccharide export with SLBB domain [Myxococcota bacterium]|jgi:protein involved in polysaccharide export with SLBB domain
MLLATNLSVKNTLRLLCLSLVLCALATSCSTTAPDGYQDIVIDTSEARKTASLGPADVFEVRVHAHKDLSGDFRVSADGTIDFPLVGRVEVAGERANEIADRIRIALANGYLLNPSVTVYVKQFNSKRVFVLGQVKKPGMFSFTDGLSIVQAIAIAGGFTGMASKNYAIVRRKEANGELRIPVPVEKIMTERSEDFPLQPGDVVFVPETAL